MNNQTFNKEELLNILKCISITVNEIGPSSEYDTIIHKIEKILKDNYNYKINTWISEHGTVEFAPMFFGMNEDEAKEEIYYYTKFLPSLQSKGFLNLPQFLTILKYKLNEEFEERFVGTILNEANINKFKDIAQAKIYPIEQYLHDYKIKVDVYEGDRGIVQCDVCVYRISGEELSEKEARYITIPESFLKSL